MRLPLGLSALSPLARRLDEVSSTATPSVTSVAAASEVPNTIHSVSHSLRQRPDASILSPSHALPSLYGRSSSAPKAAATPTPAMPSPSDTKPHGRFGSRFGTFSSPNETSSATPSTTVTSRSTAMKPSLLTRTTRSPGMIGRSSGVTPTISPSMRTSAPTGSLVTVSTDGPFASASSLVRKVAAALAIRLPASTTPQISQPSSLFAETEPLRPSISSTRTS